MSSAFQLTIDDRGIASLVFDLPGEKVNTISLERLEEFNDIIEQLEHDSSVKALVIKSPKPGVFIAGADLKSFDKIFKDPSIADSVIQRGHEVFNRLSNLSFPTIALINGVCLGGGLELALACDYRIVTDHPKVSIGLPEVTLGIMPGWGGTQRLPRLIGLEQGLKLILTGKGVDGKKAYKIKLADAIYAHEFVEDRLPDFLDKVLDSKGREEIEKRRQHTGFHHWLMEKNPLGRAALFYFARKNVLSKTKGLYPAPIVALETIEKTQSKSLKDGLKCEIDDFLDAIPTNFQNAMNLIQLFFANEELKKDPGLHSDAKPKKVNFGGVIGAGTMGAGIAWLFSYRDIPVRFKDVNWEAVGKGYKAAHDIYKKLLKIRRVKPYQIQRKFQMLSGTTDYSGFERADIVIEAATENLELKHQIFGELENVMSKDAIIASNTSSLSIAEMSKHMKHPERFLGMHFFNPPNRMPLVEIVAGEKTSPEAIATAVELCKRFKKVPLIVKDCAGFLVNRIFVMAANESSWMLQEGIEMDRLERIITQFGMPMGPCTLADEVGIDVGYKVFSVFHDAYGERMTPPKINKAMFEAGFYGKKTGKGYFLYNGKKKEPNPEVQKILDKIDTPKVTMSDEEIVDRFVLGMINEGARCLEEGIVDSPLYVDMGLVYGIGFPPFRAGLLRYADSLGIKNVVQKLKTLTDRYGARFEPCEYIQQLANTKGAFYDNETTTHQPNTCAEKKEGLCGCKH
ncbi:MAG: 3-hydroxyacyl-CoA dehydrogenase NAD-binding domain-containing protein [Chlamydiota bacterium]